MRLLPAPAVGSRTKGARRAVFLDKDGTLVENVPYNVDPALLRFTPHAEAALRRLVDAGYLLIVISNQPGIALGRFTIAELRGLAAALSDRLAAADLPLAGFYACPHAPTADGTKPTCRCRKPAPGLLIEAARAHGIDLGRSWMVGDILDDIEAGWRAGCRSVLMDVGNETVWKWSPIRVPDHRVRDLMAAADAILQAPARPTVQTLRRRATLRRPAARREVPTARPA